MKRRDSGTTAIATEGHQWRFPGRRSWRPIALTVSVFVCLVVVAYLGLALVVGLKHFEGIQ
jgi:hypothetical protein